MGDDDRIDQPEDTSRVPGTLIIAGIIILAIAIFVAQNTEETVFEFLWFNFTTPLWLVLAIVFVLGALMGQVLAWMRRRRKRDESVE